MEEIRLLVPVRPPPAPLPLLGSKKFLLPQLLLEKREGLGRVLCAASETQSPGDSAALSAGLRLTPRLREGLDQPCCRLHLPPPGAAHTHLCPRAPPALGRLMPAARAGPEPWVYTQDTAGGFSDSPMQEGGPRSMPAGGSSPTETASPNLSICFLRFLVHGMASAASGRMWHRRVAPQDRDRAVVVRVPPSLPVSPSLPTALGQLLLGLWKPHSANSGLHKAKVESGPSQWPPGQSSHQQGL